MVFTCKKYIWYFLYFLKWLLSDVQAITITFWCANFTVMKRKIIVKSNIYWDVLMTCFSSIHIRVYWRHMLMITAVWWCNKNVYLPMLSVVSWMLYVVCIIYFSFMTHQSSLLYHNFHLMKKYEAFHKFLQNISWWKCRTHLTEFRMHFVEFWMVYNWKVSFNWNFFEWWYCLESNFLQCIVINYICQCTI